MRRIIRPARDGWDAVVVTRFLTAGREVGVENVEMESPVEVVEMEVMTVELVEETAVKVRAETAEKVVLSTKTS